VTTTFGLGKSEPILALGANPIPKGEYQVFLVEANEASPPSAASPGTNFLFNKSFFIGGPRDETYLTRLKAFHEKIKQSAERESQELKQYSDTLQMQFQMLTQEFSKILKGSKAKPPSDGRLGKNGDFVEATQRSDGTDHSNLDTRDSSK
jgi:hypothetical protein